MTAELWRQAAGWAILATFVAPIIYFKIKFWLEGRRSNSAATVGARAAAYWANERRRK
jgi:hypothetical protein